MPKLDDYFGIRFCGDGDSRGQSRGWDVEMRRWDGRTSDTASFLLVAAEHRSREEADIMLPPLRLMLAVLDHRTFRNINFTSLASLG